MRLKTSSVLPVLSVMLPVFIFAFYFLGVPEKALAVSATDILLTSVPENPNPHEEVSLTLSTYSLNLDSLLITWLVNGKSVLSGVGKKSFSIESGALGVTTQIEVVIGTVNGELRKRLNIKPAVMTLLWQANDAYVPPFYKGKALLTEGSDVKIVAMPEIKSGNGTINPKNLTYSWKKDYTNDPDGSGYGKNSFVFMSDFLEPVSSVSVVASTLDQSASAEASITTSASEPEITFYKKDAVFGVDWNNALEDGHTIDQSMVLVAAPYYISPKEFNYPIWVFRWYIDEEMQEIRNYNKNMMPLTVQEGISGASTLRLDIENTDKLFQTASKSITIGF